MVTCRLTYVDTAKFLAIYFVVVSHCCMNSLLSNFLFSFHVPLFFVLYGYVYKMKCKSLQEYRYGGGKKLIFRIVVPYILLAFVLGNPFNVKSLVLIAYGSIQTLAGITSTHLWFLPCYFISVVLFNILMILCKNSKLCFYLAIVALMMISAYFNSDNQITISVKDYTFFLTGNGVSSGRNWYIGFPLALNVAFTGVGFMAIGAMIRKVLDTAFRTNWLPCCLALITLFIGVISYHLNDGAHHLIAMSLAQYGNYCYFLVSAISFSIATILISHILDNKIFAKYGKYTLSIYAFHLALMFVPAYLFKLIHVDFNCCPQTKGVVWGTILLIVSCVLIPFIRKIDSNLIGEHK